jgi:DNA-binding winged helix-turn-helix (wHTH) protein
MKYFLSHRFDDRDGSLHRDARVVAITRKASDLLRCLIDRAGTVVSHDAILAAVWPDAHVQPENIKVLIRELRRALDDHPHEPRYIRTENGRGYAFIAPLHDSPGHDAVRTGRVRARFNRPQHLTSLTDALEDAAQARCMVVVLEGERGIGKTSLCEAFMEHAAAQPSVRLCYGQSLPGSGQPPPYSTIGDALQHLVRQAPATIGPLLSRHAPHWFERICPAESRNGDAAAPPDALRMALELGAFLETLGQNATTAIVLDDLQWGDAETIRLIQALARRHAPLRTLIVLTCTRLPPSASGSALWRLLMDLWSTGRCVMRRLRPLGQEDVRACLVERFGPGPAAALAPTIHRLTGGNPLALTTMMDAMTAGDLASPDAFEASLPEEAREAMLWRFAQLEPSSRMLLESAAGVGTVFTSDDVAAAAGCEAMARIEHQLDALCARGFVERVGHGPSGAKCYGFLHPLHAELLASRAGWFDQLHDADLHGHEVAGPYN